MAADWQGGVVAVGRARSDVSMQAGARGGGSRGRGIAAADRRAWEQARVNNTDLPDRRRSVTTTTVRRNGI